MNTGTINTEKEVIVVSGGSGLIGEALINELAKKYLVVGLDHVGYPFPPITSECVCMDITSDQSVEIAFKRIRYAYGNKIAAVVHLAAYYDFAGKPSPLYQKITVEGTERLLKVLQGFDVEQFIFSSSLLVYKSTNPGVKITEESALDPKWDYPKSKVKTEQILQEKKGKIPVLNLRIAGIYNTDGHSIPIAHHIQRIYENQLTSHFYPGKFDHGNPYLHLDDLIDAMLKGIDRRNEFKGMTTINLGEADTMSFIELQQSLAELIHGKKWKTYKIPKLLAKYGAWVQNLFGDPFIKPWMIARTDDHMELDISKAQQLLNWKPKHTLRNTLPKMIEKLKSEPLNWYRKNKLEPPSELKKRKG